MARYAEPRQRHRLAPVKTAKPAKTMKRARIMPMARSRCRAFTLLEILVALAVLATVSIAILQQSGSSVRQLSDLESRTLARWVAQTDLAKARLERGDSTAKPKLGVERDRVVQGTRTWQVVRTTAATSHKHMYRIDIAVYAVEGGREIGPLDTLTAYFGRY